MKNKIKYVLQIKELKDEVAVLHDLAYNKEKIEKLANVLSVRNVTPQFTDKRVVTTKGMNFAGLKKVLVALGYDALKVEDVIDAYDKPVIYVKNENGQNTTYMDTETIKLVVNDVLQVLESDKVTRRMMRDDIISVMNKLVYDKANYVLHRCDDEVKELEKAYKILSKYDVYKNKCFFGYQQYAISKELSNFFGRTISFSNGLRELGLKYKWSKVHKPYYVTHGQDWLVCKIDY